MSVRIGIDLDNTIIRYDHVFASQAVTLGYLDSARDLTKKQIRDAIRGIPDGELKWQDLQANVYGPRIGEAQMFTGAAEFLCRCRDAGAEVFIVSHKTQFAAADRNGTDLRAAARGWLADHAFHARDGFAVPKANVFFEDARAEKIERIAELFCDVFIDDLEEVLRHPAFPNHTRPILFASDTTDLPKGQFYVCRSWKEVSDAVFAAVG